MEANVLRKVQLEELNIAKEVKRVCEENGIRYFMCCGTLLGAIRHQGFIPWDDDMDLGMPRDDYEKFCRIAPEKLGPDYCLQNWYTDPDYALPFAKVRRRGSLYLEAKGTRLKENGFYVDIFPFDYAPEASRRGRHGKRLCALFRMKLMKSGYKPWMDVDRINWVKRLGYAYYQFRALFYTGERLAKKYDALAAGMPESGTLCRQRGLARLECYDAAWYQTLAEYPFEDTTFAGPEDADAVLKTQFGDYMCPPPEGQRENRHQIIRVEFDM